jgi:WD40 repeat protein
MEITRKHTCTGHRAAVYALAPGRDARHVCSAGGDGWIVEWDLDDPETGKVVANVETQVFSLCAFPHQHLVVAGNMNGGVHWIDLAHPDKTRNIQHHKKGVYDIRASGEWLYTAGGDGILTRWSLQDARAKDSFHLSNRALRTIAISETRNEIAVGASDGAIYFLEADTLTLKNTLHGAHGHSVFALAYTPTQQYLLSGGRDAMLRVWNLENAHARVSEQPAHWYTINHIVFSPDGRHFATASRDRTIKIWDTGTFQLLRVLDTIRDGGHINSVNRLLWLPDCLISGSDDRSLILWQER